MRMSIRMSKTSYLLKMLAKLMYVQRFFKAPFYDTKVVDYAEKNKEPFSLMEVITLSQADLLSPEYTGPVLVITLSLTSKLPRVVRN